MSTAASNFIHIRARRGHEVTLGKQLCVIVETLGNSAGCLAYQVLQGDQRDLWHVRGDWISEMAMHAHFRLPALQAFIALCQAGLASSLAFDQHTAQIRPAAAADHPPETTPARNESAIRRFESA